MATKIEWVRNKDGTPGVTWNPFVGCTHSGSPGCDHCYARETHNRRHNAYYSGKKMPEQYAMPFDTIQFIRERLELPLKWKKPRTIFVNSVSDLFHPGICDEWIHAVYDVMEAAKQHTFIICTKRPERIIPVLYDSGYLGLGDYLPNVWHLCTVENQEQADRRIPELLRLKDYSGGWPVLGISVEPMLGDIDISEWLEQWQCPECGVWESHERFCTTCSADRWDYDNIKTRGLGWCIVGGETGPKARPMHPEWPRSLRDQCQVAGVPFFFKSWGEWGFEPYGNRKGLNPYQSITMGSEVMFKCGKKAAGRLLDGREWNEMPEVRT